MSIQRTEHHLLHDQRTRRGRRAQVGHQAYPDNFLRKDWQVSSTRGAILGVWAMKCGMEGGYRRE